MNETKSKTEITSPIGTEAQQDAAGTVPAGPSGAGRGATGPAAGELAPCDSPAVPGSATFEIPAPDLPELATFVGGPLNGYRVESAAAAIVVERDGSGHYVRDGASDRLHWHVGAPQLAELDQVRPAEPEAVHIRPAPEAGAQVRPRRSRRSR